MINLILLLLSLSFNPLYNSTANTVVLVQPYCAPHIVQGGWTLQLPWSYKYVTASGVFVSRYGRVLTAKHVADLSGIFRVTTKDGKVRLYGVLAKHPTADLAILQPLYPVGDIQWVEVGREPRIGDVVACIGHPGGLMYNFTIGVVTQYRNELLISDVVINMGNSGGGLFDLRGSLVGITSAIVGPSSIPSYQGHSLFVRTSYVREFIRRYQ
jgi:S1-C subfamily serine protease